MEGSKGSSSLLPLSDCSALGEVGRHVAGRGCLVGSRGLLPVTTQVSHLASSSLAWVKHPDVYSPCDILTDMYEDLSQR